MTANVFSLYLYHFSGSTGNFWLDISVFFGFTYYDDGTSLTWTNWATTPGFFDDYAYQSYTGTRKWTAVGSGSAFVLCQSKFDFITCDNINRWLFCLFC